MILVYSPANPFQENTCYTIPCDLFPVLSPLLWYAQKSYTFKKKKKIQVQHVFSHYKPPLHYFPCFSTRKILDPCQDQRERGVGCSQIWKGETHSLLERRALPSCPQRPWRSRHCLFPHLPLGGREGRKLRFTSNFARREKGMGPRSWPGLPTSYFFYLRTTHQILRRRHFFFGGLGSGHDNYLAIRILEITLSGRIERS